VNHKQDIGSILDMLVLEARTEAKALAAAPLVIDTIDIQESPPLINSAVGVDQQPNAWRGDVRFSLH